MYFIIKGIFMVFCKYCKGNKKIKVPNRKEEFDTLVDYFDSQGQLSYSECEEKAYKLVGFKYETCPFCKS
jgi:hypothetical protein